MDNKRLAYLLQQYATKAMTAAEAEEVLRLIDDNNEDDATQEIAVLMEAQSSEVVDMEAMSLLSSIEKIVAVDRPIDEKKVVTAGIFMLGQKPKKVSVEMANASQQVQTDIVPGGDKAILTLADGTRIILDSVANGHLAEQGGVKVIKIGGQIAYNTQNKQQEVLYNTISTPKGGQYQLVLADGTKVWLNAASSLRFPTSFTGKERSVELTGEGYFEVAHDASMAFQVKVKDMKVEVLGTHFNINSYTDEETIKTTLLEGSIKVQKGDMMILLSPGQQAQTTDGQGSVKLEKRVDVEAALAWKNGLFHLDGADVKTIGRQIARWYDIEVKCTGNLQSAHLSGEIPRSLNLSQVIEVLETSGIDVKLVGRTLTIIPQS
jgi:ferric-dicitrate binding protein FerR (iron transport regulator)